MNKCTKFWDCNLNSHTMLTKSRIQWDSNEVGINIGLNKPAQRFVYRHK